MASLYVKYPKTCRNKKSSVYVTPPTSIASSSSGSLSSSDGIKSSSVSQSKRKHHLCIHHTNIRGHKVSIALPKRKKLKLKKSPPSTSTSSDSEIYKECWPFIINNNIRDETDRNDVYTTCKAFAIKKFLIEL